MPSVTTTYIVTVTAPNGCTATDDIIVTVDKILPTANAGADVTLNCTTTSTTLSATGGGTYAWNNGATQGGIVIPLTTTTYTVTVTDANGCQAIDNIIITVDKNLPVVSNNVYPNQCNNNNTLTLGGTPSGGVFSGTGVTGTNFNASIAGVGTFPVTYTFTGANGCTNTAVSNVIVNNAPSVVASLDVTICNGVNTSLTATGAVSYSWSPNIGLNTSTAATVIASPINTNTYTVVGTDANGCTATDDVIVTVTAPITTTFAQIAPLCLNSVAPILPNNSTNTPAISGTWNPATINTSVSGTTTYTFTPNVNECATIFNMNININNLAIPSFTAINPLCLGATAPTLPNISNNGINGTWNPSTISTATSGTTTYTFTPNNGECAASVPIDITVSNAINPIFAAIAPICIGGTAPVLSTTSNNGIVGTWNPSVINTATAGTSTYTFMPNSGQCSVDLPINVDILNSVNPTFTQLGPYCVGGNPDVLPNVSNNGINGSWSPATISTTTAGTQTFTFTPSVGAQCAVSQTMTINVNTATTTTFATIKNTYCVNETADILPNTSSNGIFGTWNPSAISTITAGFTNYTFTPSVGQCATTVPLTVSISAPVMPIFPNFGPYCLNSSTVTLPTVSNNIPPINGTWSPATVNTAVLGINPYTFTPNANECASTKTINIEIGAGVDPTFPIFGPYCVGAAGFTLPLISNNNIQGTWSIPSVNTSVAGTVAYTFTPDAGQCGNLKTINIVVGAPQNSVFANIKNVYCLGSTPDALPLSDDNGINGTWNPALINTAVAGNSTYTFTPNNGVCANTFVLQVEIKAIVVPTPTTLGPYCQNQIGVGTLPNTVGTITGTWNPSIISTTTTGASIYTFTPNDPTQCAASTTLNVTINPNVTPTFTPIANLCQGSAAPVLPTVSLNGINGTWSPSTINTASAGSTTYTFTPSIGECATSTTLSVNVTASIVPSFSQINPICVGSVAPVLPTTSQNGIVGTWNPTNINTLIVGNSNYLFTPSSTAQCANSTIFTVNIKDKETPIFSSINICEGVTPPSLPSVSQNNISGTWNPSTVSNSSAGTFTYNFTPSAGQCANNGQLTVNVSSAPVPTFAQLGPFCLNVIPPVLPTTSQSGITGTWFPATIDTKNIGKIDYIFTPTAGQCAKSTKMTIEVGPAVLPSFDPIGPLCVNSIAPALPSTSKNNIKGTWSPSSINTSTKGTQSFTFTPDVGQCGSVATINIVISAPVVTTFDGIGILCEGSTAPTLSLASKEGINGTWNPLTINTKIVGTTTYTFTPSGNQCAKTAMLDVNVDAIKLPVFDTIGQICLNASAPILNQTSKNGIKGTWNPSTIKTDVAGTFSFVFTPDAGICSKPLTLKVVVTAPLLPTFSISNLCIGDVLTLPVIANNKVNGTWDTPNVNTTLAGTTTYTFTPNANQCALVKTLNIKVDAPTKPIFDKINPYCVGAAAPTLPLTSKNGIKGTWNPAVINTSIAGKTAYVFTPDAGVCANKDTLEIEITAPVTAQFATFGPYCLNTPNVVLPTKGTNNIVGTWNPSTVVTNVLSKKTYTFTPSANQCAISSGVEIDVVDAVISKFSVANKFCLGDAPTTLPLKSDNNVNGTWTPSAINTATAGTTIYNFKPNVGECGLPTTLSITIEDNVLPVFDAIQAICENAPSINLATTSKNNIAGSWNPAAVNTSIVGTKVYTFNKNPGVCAKTTTMSIEVKPTLTPVFDKINPYCDGETPILLTNKDKNNVTGTWNPATIDTKKIGTTTYTFTPTAGQCAVNTSLDVLVNAKKTPIFTLKDTYCEGKTTDVLNTSSDNAITGTWNPSVISNSKIGTSIYTFTPNSNECALLTTQSINIVAKTLPSFNLKKTYCDGETAQTLPVLSDNGVSGDWSPSSIDTKAIGINTYTFVPKATECALPFSIVIKVNPILIPSFDIKTNYCIDTKADDLLPIDKNGINGTWTPNTIVTTKAGKTMYQFKPNAGICANTVDFEVTINAKTKPLFDEIGPYCKAKKSDTLTNISLNGIKGSWNPSIVSTKVVGVKDYTFTPNTNECAINSSLTVAIIEKPNLLATATPTHVCPGESTALKVTGVPKGATITWNRDAGNDANAIVTPTLAGAYIVKVKIGADCESEAYVYVDIRCKEDFYAPSSFSPNGDNVNDVFTIFGGKNIEEVVSLRVFDRWGEVLFENKNFQPNKESEGWNGVFRDSEIRTGVYIYFTEIKFKDGKTHRFSGDIFLHR